jgi:hypothetical protein
MRLNPAPYFQHVKYIPNYNSRLVSQILSGITARSTSNSELTLFRCNFGFLISSHLLTRTTMSRLSHGVTVEYLEEGLVVRSRKRAKRSINADIQQSTKSSLSAQIAGT